jgi:hypothetical protein
MLMLSKIIEKTKKKMRFASGVKIVVRRSDGVAVHGRVMIEPHGLEKLLGKTDLPDWRSATFCREFACCIGAQIGATVSLEFAGRPVDGRRALKSLM